MQYKQQTNKRPTHRIAIKYLIAQCPRCRRRHFGEDTIVQNNILICKQTGCKVTRLEQPTPIHVHQFFRFRVTLTQRIVLKHGALRAGYSFHLTHPRVVESCLQVETKKYGIVALPMSALEMEPVVERGVA